MDIRRVRYAWWIALLAIGLLSCQMASADVSSANVLDRVQERYATVVSFWAASIEAKATWLFWTLALISMVWTFGMMALRKADVAEFFAEFIRFTIFTGFFWWLLANGPQFAIGIINSLKSVGATAAQAGAAGAGMPAPAAGMPSPSGVMDVGFTMFKTVISKSSVWSPFASAVGILVSLIVLVVMALIAVNMLILLVAGWMLAYAGIFFLGFGGSRWTSEMAISYFRTVLNLAAQVMAMVLIVGVGSALVISMYGEMSSSYRLEEMAVILVASIVLLGLVNKVPGMVGALASGGGTAALGSGYGAGAVVAAATMAGAAAATVGAAAAAAAANIGGGAQALMAAFSKASQDASAGGVARDFLTGSGASGEGGGGGSKPAGGSPLAEAMGTPPSPSSGGSTGHQAGGSGEHGGAGGGSASSKAASEDSSGREQDGPRDEDEGSQASSGNQAKESAKSKAPQRNEGRSSTKGLAGAAGKAGKIAVGTLGNVALGGVDVGAQGMRALLDKANNRMAATVGGKMAAAIKARQAASSKASGSSRTANSVSAASTAVDVEAEVAAFRDKKDGPGEEQT